MTTHLVPHARLADTLPETAVSARVLSLRRLFKLSLHETQSKKEEENFFFFF